MNQDRIKGFKGVSEMFSRMSLPTTLIAVTVLPVMTGFAKVLESYGRADALALAFGIVLASIVASHWGDEHPGLSAPLGEVLTYLFCIWLGGMFAAIPVMILGMVGGIPLEDSVGESKARLIATGITGLLCVAAFLFYIGLKGTKPTRVINSHNPG